MNKTKKCVWYHGLNNIFQCSKNIKYVFGMCVLDDKKNWPKYEITFFLSGERTSIYSRCSSLSFFIPSLPWEQKTKPTFSPHLHRHQRRSTARLHVPWISSPLSALQDLATNRASIAAESLTHHPKIQVQISLSPCLSMGFCLKTKPFLLHSQIFHFFFFFFGFPHQSEKPPTFLFFVCCWNNIWFTIQTYTPYIHEIF